jgi:hypothetical protein
MGQSLLALSPGAGLASHRPREPTPATTEQRVACVFASSRPMSRRTPWPRSSRSSTPPQAIPPTPVSR